MINPYFPFSALFNLTVTLAMGLFIFLKNPRGKTNRVFLVFALSIAVWSFGYFRWNLAGNQQSAIFWCRILTLGSTWITLWYYCFAVNLLGIKGKKYTIILFSGIIAATIFTVLNMTTGLLIKTTRPMLTFSYWPVPGILYLPQLAMFIFYGVYSLVLMWHEYKRSGEFRKKQIRYVFLGYAVGFVGGCTNYPQWYGINMLPLGNILVGIYPISVGYSIIRYHLLEIDTVIHRTTLWILTSCSILIPIGAMLYFTRPWFVALSWLPLTFITTGLFYLFLYYYRKMQPKIDHFFRRRKYDYYQVLGEIGQKIGSELDINNVISRLFTELKEILYIRNGLVLVQQPDQLKYSEAGSIGYEQAWGQKREPVVLDYQAPLAKWICTHQRALEREQLESDSQYELIKELGLNFMEQNRIEIFIPVVMENKVNALIGIGKKENLQAYTIKDIELLENMGRQMGITIDNALHHEDIVEKERLAEELKLGREIQVTLLPQETPDIPGLTVFGLMVPAKEIGGDYYDFITFPNKDHLGIVIGDVSGKGVAAGLLMAMAKTAIHTLSQEDISPKQILLKTNQILHRHIGGQKFMTLLYLKWEYPDLNLAYSSAGHEHILIYKGHLSGAVEAIRSGGFMLGMIENIEGFIEEKRLKLDPKDKILLYTDGVTEAENQAGERFGFERLKEALRKHGPKPAYELMHAVKDEVYAFIGSHPQYDDITLVVMEAK